MKDNTAERRLLFDTVKDITGKSTDELLVSDAVIGIEDPDSKLIIMLTHQSGATYIGAAVNKMQKEYDEDLTNTEVN